jgi:hypothetical protein
MIIDLKKRKKNHGYILISAQSCYQRLLITDEFYSGIYYVLNANEAKLTGRVKYRNGI